MGNKRKLSSADTDVVVSSKRKKVGSGVVLEVTTSKSPRKQRRPWRNKLRKKAAREAKRMREEKANHGLADKDTTALDNEQTGHRKKKKKKKKKKYESISGDPGGNTFGTSQEVIGMEVLDSALFRYINEQLYTMTGDEAVQLFQKDPHAFEVYHKGYQKQMKRWPYNPVHGIIQWIRTLARDGLVVADMGCGDAKIALALSTLATVHSFDLVAANDRVTACNMAKVPLESESVDIVVFCLSLMGTNLSDYFREANRLLKKGGFLKIAEVASRFTSVKQFVHAVSKMGFDITEQKVRGDGYFVILEFIKRGKVEQKRPLGMKLKPCLYKKR